MAPKLRDLARDQRRPYIESVDEPTCTCGHDRFHPKAEANPSYGPFGWALLMLGATPVPRHVEYRCRTCGASLGISQDTEDIRRVT